MALAGSHHRNAPTTRTSSSTLAALRGVAGLRFHLAALTTPAPAQRRPACPLLLREPPPGLPASSFLLPASTSRTSSLSGSRAYAVRAVSSSSTSQPTQQQRRQHSRAAAATAAAAEAQEQIRTFASDHGIARMPMVRDTVELNDTERELFSTLLAAVRHANSKTVMRCAGGWVRDKLLGKDSVDIDIALDDMLGKDFAQLVNQYLSSQGQETRAPAVIQSNPDQSKHLETARMKLGGLWVDLVNLRSETYAADSRIPTMAFGTAEQDAMRRDFTVNSLFYNINTGAVEDMTGKGLQDLRAGIIRTPLPPQETFLDDPLRVLRAVRFATRFGFELQSDILAAASSEPVRTALGQKVSKERIGTELEGMFHGQAPVAAVELLLRLSLLPVVFALPPQAAQLVGGEDWGAACLACMKAQDALLQARQVKLEQEDRRVLHLASLLLPLRLLQAPTGPKGKPQPVVQHVVRESIKWRAKDADTSQLLHEVAPTLLDIYCQLSSAGGRGASVPDALKVELGNALRKLKQHWQLGLLLAPVLATRAARPLGVDAASPDAGAGGALRTPPELDDPEQEAARSVEVVGTLMAAADAWGLRDCWQWKPLLDGKRVMAALGLQKPGPELGKAMAVAMDWQLVHPSGTADECEQAVKQWHSQQQQQ